MFAKIRASAVLRYGTAGRGAVAGLFVALSLAGCASDETTSSLLVSPRKYQFHNCKLLAGALTSTRTRIDELQKLMGKAAQAPGGTVIGAAAYRTEYLQARGDEKQIVAMIEEKNCRNESGWVSERTVH